MITLTEYFQKPHSPRHRANAAVLLDRVNTLLGEAAKAGAYKHDVDPDTGSRIGGEAGGDGDGGFRTPGSRTGGPGSAHRTAEAVDVYDPAGKLDAWITDEALVYHGLFREHPDATPTWCHLTTRAPKSGARTFRP